MKIGTALIKNNHWSIIKIIDLNSLVVQLENNIEEYSKLKLISSSNSETYRELMGLTVQTESFIELTRDRLQQIIPSSRAKRGILNPLGSIIKVITGNLDSEDARRYNLEISNLKDREHSVERKVTLMQNAFDKLVNVSDNINFNTKHLNYKLKQFRSLVQNQTRYSNMITIMNSLNQIYNNFRTIYTVIYEIETAIAFCKLHILHQSIVNTTELYNTLKVIEKHSQLIYPVSKDTLVKLERNIEIKGYIDNGKIVFILEIPLIQKSTYIYYKIIPIPIYNPNQHKTFTIIPKYPYLIVNRMKYRSVVDTCKEIDDLRYLCSEEDIVQYPVETCIEQLMLLKSNFSECQQYQVQIEEVKVQPVSENHWLIYTEKGITATESCNDELRKYNLQGTYILLPSPQCTLQIGDTYITTPTNSSAVFFSLPPVQMPELRDIAVPPAKQMDLRGVDFGDIRDLLTRAKYSESYSESQAYIVSDRISVWTLGIYVIIIVIILVFILYKCSLHTKVICGRNSLETTQLPLDNSSPKGGGVKCAKPTDISFVSTTLPTNSSN